MNQNSKKAVYSSNKITKIEVLDDKIILKMPISSGFGSNNCNTTIHLPNNITKLPPARESAKSPPKAKKPAKKLNDELNVSMSQKKTNSQKTTTTTKLNDSFSDLKANQNKSKNSKLDLSFKENFSIKKNVLYMNNRNRLHGPGTNTNENISKSSETINEQPLNPSANVLQSMKNLNRTNSEISLNYYYKNNPYENLFDTNSKEDTFDATYQSVEQLKHTNQEFNNQEYFSTNGKPFKRRPSKYDEISNKVLKDIAKDDDSMVVSSNSILSDKDRTNPNKTNDKKQITKKNAEVQVEPEEKYVESSDTEYEFEIDADADGEIVIDRNNNFKFFIQDKRRARPKMSDEEVKNLISHVSDKIEEDRKEGLTIYINRDGSKKGNSSNSSAVKKVTESNAKSKNTSSAQEPTKIDRNTKSTNTPRPEFTNISSKATKSKNKKFQSAEPQKPETPRMINNQGTQTKIQIKEVRNESPTKSFKNSTVQCDLSTADFYEVEDRSPRFRKVIIAKQAAYLPEEQYRILPNIKLYNREQSQNKQYLINNIEQNLQKVKKVKIISDPVEMREVLSRKKSMQDVELPHVQRVNVKNKIFTNIRRPVKFLNQIQA